MDREEVVRNVNALVNNITDEITEMYRFHIRMIAFKPKVDPTGTWLKKAHKINKYAERLNAICREITKEVNNW